MIMAWTAIGALLVIIGYLLYRDYLQNEQWSKERKEFMNRLMSKDFTDYSTNEAYLQKNLVQELMEKIEKLER